ncbi:NAD(P)-binding protein [Aaosphaeria arxii CBS 175.79]|uniref:NAD(P)-binding protein n=1 Tax=Aaosphaeria arxii CBS 175.79 TaxID=1450172 RepID=A0A6A5XRJ8_9PLEO|nr:NAD(P)-binding protein [Aaosphaeria arxii CBS 175.79]KAF2015371.1 NAD(P)-binding protein [Aaosphaeria arxii CBS 175.79]
MSSKLITIFGATGAQGSSVLQSLQSNTNKSFKLRAITRNPSSDSALKISSSGVEVVKADGWDKESLVAAFKGSWGVFVNTNSDDAVFENPEEKRTELDLGRIVVDAAVEAGVSVFVYSGMASARETTEGKIPVQAFDEKHAIGEYAKSTGAFQSTAIVSPGWYFENFLSPEMAGVFGGFPYTPSDDGTLVFKAPTWGGKEDIPFIAIANDYGDIVHGVFLDPERWNGKLVQGVSDISSLPDMIEGFEKVTGKKARFEEIPWKDLETYGIRALDTVKHMFGFCQESGGRYYGVVTDSKATAELKKSGAEARGKSGQDVELLTLQKFFKENFSN